MGLFSKREEPGEPSFSRRWISQNGAMSRKSELAIAIVKQLTMVPVGSAEAWRHPFDEQAQASARELISHTVTQDRSLVRHVCRDVALLFESFGGLFRHQESALESVGLSSSSQIPQVAGSALAVARVIQARSQDGNAGSGDVALYTRMFEEQSDAAQDLALDVGAWCGTVTARLRTHGLLPGDGIPIFQAHASQYGRMEAAGWYPNPVNAGDTSNGEASIERYWDGDWTSRLRVREGRRWSEQDFTLFKAPAN